MSNSEESFEDLKYLLGNMGIEIFFAIDKGAKDFETIKLFSGVSIACIKGRVPVLLGLNLIIEKEGEYHLTERGSKFKKKLKEARV
jgi:predicted transcriptional regulator